jgi:hypothetical protein
MAKMQRGCGSVICLLGVLLLLLAGSVQATTWNEPWHEEVMLASDSFVKVRIIEVRDTGCKAEVLKFLAGGRLVGSRHQEQLRHGSAKIVRINKIGN